MRVQEAGGCPRSGTLDGLSGPSRAHGLAAPLVATRPCAKSHRSPLIVLALAALVLPAPGSGQGIGEVAARERAKREKQSETEKQKTPNYTDDDLEGMHPPGQKKDAQTTDQPAASAAPVAPVEEPSASVEPNVSEPAPPPPDEVAVLEREVQEIEARLQMLHDKLNPMSGSFIYGATGSNKADEEAQVRSEIPEVEASLAQARQQLAAAREAAEQRARKPPETPLM